MVAVSPMLPAAGPLPSGPSWVFEVKWDGFRALTHCARGGIRLHTRSGREVTAQLPELHPLSEALGRSALLDGELIVVGDDGRPDFERLRRRLLSHRPGVGDLVQLVVFDLLALDDQPLVDLPYLERRRWLDDLELAGEHWHTPPFYADGEALLEATLTLGLEGVVAKRLESRYHPGRRNGGSWVKTKHRIRSSLRVGGWMASPDGRIDQLLVGYPLVDGGLVYAGRVELGLTRSARQALAPHVEQLACEVSPFGFRLTRAHWVEPQLEVLVDHGPPTASGRLREPLFAGLLLPWRSVLHDPQ